ncbi:MAG: GNAT family N-acetyltransferase [Defluviitaleaceae bacterium]|nr:GNAT family N-acetyltransferase [Defluviitaleaceae bacterium]
MKKNYNEILYKNQYIECKDIILRKYTEADIEGILEFGSDAKTLEHLDWEGLSTIEEAKDNLYNYYWSSPGIYAIEIKGTQGTIGTIDIRVKTDNHSASCGYVLNRKHWGKGYMPQALGAILKLLFEEIEINKFEIQFYGGNEKSGRVMEKNGLVLEGVLKQSKFLKGKYRDVHLYGMTKEMYKTMLL